MLRNVTDNAIKVKSHFVVETHKNVYCFLRHANATGATMKPHRKIIRHINKYLADNGISQEQLAERMGRKKAGVGHYLREDRQIKLEVFFQIMEAIGQHPSSFINAALNQKEEGELTQIGEVGIDVFHDKQLASTLAQKMLQLERHGKLDALNGMADILLADFRKNEARRKKK